MADDPILFRARAAAEQAAADAATLDNVRDRALRAAKAWTEMADRAERTGVQRAQREAATAAKVAADRQFEPADAAIGEPETAPA